MEWIIGVMSTMLLSVAVGSLLRGIMALEVRVRTAHRPGDRAEWE